MPVRAPSASLQAEQESLGKYYGDGHLGTPPQVWLSNYLLAADVAVTLKNRQTDYKSEAGSSFGMGMSPITTQLYAHLPGFLKQVVGFAFNSKYKLFTTPSKPQIQGISCLLSQYNIPLPSNHCFSGSGKDSSLTSCTLSRTLIQPLLGNARERKNPSFFC